MRLGVRGVKIVAKKSVYEIVEEFEACVYCQVRHPTTLGAFKDLVSGVECELTLPL